MSIKKITFKGVTKSVKQWSIELDIPTRTIYQRLELDWPPELVLSKKYFNYCNDLKAAKVEEKREGYPTNTYRSGLNFCCDFNAICEHAVPLTEWNEISNDPSEAHYYCKMLNKFVWGENPICQ